MRLCFLTPGTGSFLCGSCLRDNTLAQGLIAQGHDVSVVPLYLPHYLEEDQAASTDVHLGGINMYLQHRAPLLRFLPRWLHDLLDRPGLLRWVSRRSSMTASPDLGALTVSTLRGEQGRLASELERLVHWMSGAERPDVVVLSNVMLVGLARRIKEAFGVPILCTLQGEEPFLDTLPGPFRDEAWGVLRERAREVDAFVAVSHWYGGSIGPRLGLDPARVHPVHNGIDLADFPQDDGAPEARRPPDHPPTIGFLARMCEDKGFPLIVEAFERLAQRNSVPGVRLDVAGVVLGEDRPLVDAARGKLAAAGLAGRATFRPNVSREEKLTFLRGLDVFSVPAHYGESFGLYLLEALAMGVPVVQPDCGPFPELVEATGGGRLCAAHDAESLADGLEALLLDPAAARQLGTAGRRRVHEHFHVGRMAREVATIASMLGSAAGPRTAGATSTPNRARPAHDEQSTGPAPG